MRNILENAVPYIEKLEKSGLKDNLKKDIAALKTTIQELSTSGISNLAPLEHNFSNTEVQIINLIKDGKKTKEIAKLCNLDSRAVEYHRLNLRKKLGLTNAKGSSLSRYLRNFEL